VILATRVQQVLMEQQERLEQQVLMALMEQQAQLVQQVLALAVVYQLFRLVQVCTQEALIQVKMVLNSAGLVATQQHFGHQVLVM
jgi:hypothetical protein